MGVEPAVLTDAEVEVLKALARHMGQPAPTVELVEHEGWETTMRRIAREEIAAAQSRGGQRPA